MICIRDVFEIASSHKPPILIGGILRRYDIQLTHQEYVPYSELIKESGYVFMASHT